MRAVTGIVRSSKPISLSKASAILSRFAAADIGARSDIAAYLKRASAAFEDLVQVHRELRSSRKRVEQGVAHEEGQESNRRKKKEKGGDPNPDENLQSKVKLEVLEEEEEAEVEERRNKKRKKKKEREDGSLEVYDKGNLMDVERNIEERRDHEKNYAELNGKVKVEVEEVEEDRSAERKKKEEKKKKRDREVVENGGGEIEDGSARREKKKRRRKTEE